MRIDTDLFYLILIISVVHSALVILLDYLYLRQTRRYHELKAEIVRGAAEKDRQVSQILDDVRQKSRGILVEATNSATRLMSEAKVFTGAEEEAFKSALDKGAEEYEIRFQEALLRLQADTEQMLKNLTLEMKKPLTIQVDAFTGSFQKELTRMREETRSQVANLQKQSLEEVSRYKEQKLQEVKSVIVELMRDMAREVIGHEISPEKHEELVMKALEEAVRQKMF